jgi:amino acid transporter
MAFSGNGATYGPFAGLATALGLSWLATLLYIDAIISPGGTGLLYVGTSSRVSFALARNRYIPRRFSQLSPRGVPFLAIVFSFLCGMIVFLPFPGWQQLVGFITSATVLAYATAPLAFGALRREVPHHERPFRLPGGALLAPAAFIVANELILFSGWAVVWKLIVAILIGFALLAISAATSPPDHKPFHRVARRHLARAVPDRPRRDLVPELVRHQHAELGARSPRTDERPEVRLGRAGDGGVRPRGLPGRGANAAAAG